MTTSNEAGNPSRYLSRISNRVLPSLLPSVRHHSFHVIGVSSSMGIDRAEIEVPPVETRPRAAMMICSRKQTKLRHRLGTKVRVRFTIPTADKTKPRQRHLAPCQRQSPQVSGPMVHQHGRGVGDVFGPPRRNRRWAGALRQKFACTRRDITSMYSTPSAAGPASCWPGAPPSHAARACSCSRRCGAFAVCRASRR